MRKKKLVQPTFQMMMHIDSTCGRNIIPAMRAQPVISRKKMFRVRVNAVNRRTTILVHQYTVKENSGHKEHPRSSVAEVVAS